MKHKHVLTLSSALIAFLGLIVTRHGINAAVSTPLPSFNEVPVVRLGNCKDIRVDGEGYAYADKSFTSYALDGFDEKIYLSCGSTTGTVGYDAEIVPGAYYRDYTEDSDPVVIYPPNIDVPVSKKLSYGADLADYRMRFENGAESIFARIIGRGSSDGESQAIGVSSPVFSMADSASKGSKSSKRAMVDKATVVKAKAAPGCGKTLNGMIEVEIARLKENILTIDHENGAIIACYKKSGKSVKYFGKGEARVVTFKSAYAEMIADSQKLENGGLYSLTTIHTHPLKVMQLSPPLAPDNGYPPSIPDFIAVSIDRSFFEKDVKLYSYVVDAENNIWEYDVPYESPLDKALVAYEEDPNNILKCLVDIKSTVNDMFKPGVNGVGPYLSAIRSCGGEVGITTLPIKTN